MTEAYSLIQQLDSKIEKFLSGWNIFTTILAITLVTYWLYPILFAPEPDTHPLLLASQATASRVRQPGESAIFRSLETPHGYPLRAGLNVKDHGSPKWAAGRDGDLRDVWKQASRGFLDSDDKETGSPGKVFTVLGKEEVIQYEFSTMTEHINAVGKFINDRTGSRVAIYLPNSVEFLITFFAATFYGFTPMLIFQKESSRNLAQILHRTQADVLVAAAGTIPLNDLLKAYSRLKQIVWVVERASRHLDWNEVPREFGDSTNITAWHDIVHNKDKPFSSDLPEINPNVILPNVVVAHRSSGDTETSEIVEFTQKNIIAAMAAQISVLPKSHRLGPSDLLLTLEPLTNIWALTLTLVALFSNSSIALTSAATLNPKYDVIGESLSPTVVVASALTMSQANKDLLAKQKGLFQKIKFWRHANSLTSGVMPKSARKGAVPRLIYISSNADSETQSLDSAELFNLRAVTGSHLIYALTNSKVAGAIAQTNIFDYADRNSGSNKQSHFGPPLSSVELKFKEIDRKFEGEPVGWLVVGGPAVVTEETTLRQTMTVTNSNTLCYL